MEETANSTNNSSLEEQGDFKIQFFSKAHHEFLVHKIPVTTSALQLDLLLQCPRGAYSLVNMALNRLEEEEEK